MERNEFMKSINAEHICETKGERLYRIKTIDKREHDIPFDEIILIQSSPQYGILELHRACGFLEIYGKITRISTNIPEFFHCYTSFVVNINHIEGVDEVNRKLVLSGGRTVPIAKSKIKRLIHVMGVSE